MFFEKYISRQVHAVSVEPEHTLRKRNAGVHGIHPELTQSSPRVRVTFRAPGNSQYLLVREYSTITQYTIYTQYTVHNLYCILYRTAMYTALYCADIVNSSMIKIVQHNKMSTSD